MTHPAEPKKKRAKWFMKNRRKMFQARVAKIFADRMANPPGPHPRIEIALKNPYGVEPGQLWWNIDSRAGVSSKAGPMAVIIGKLLNGYALAYWSDPWGKLDMAGALKTSWLRLDVFRTHERKAVRWGGGGRGWKLMTKK